MTKRIWLVACALAALALLAPRAAEAGEFDEYGRFALDGAVSWGLDGPEDAPFGYVAYDWNNDPIEPTFATVEDGLEGTGELLLGGPFYYFGLDLSSAAASLTGRRVDFRVWQRSAGTTATLSVGWRVGSGSFRESVTLGSISLLPTGRQTSDGWREFATGPVDFDLAGVPATYLSVQDTQITPLYYNQSQFTVDADVRVSLDGFEIVDLGPAGVPDAACSLLDADSVCGDAGVCLYGRCVDSAAIFGATPGDAIIGDYVGRRTFEMEAFNGVRAARTTTGPTFAEAMAAARDGLPRDFWPGLRFAYDGHGAPPSANFGYGPLGNEMCVYYGDADLSGLGISPMIFEISDTKPYAASLAVGDVLVSIDGVDVDTSTISSSRRLARSPV